MNLLFVLLVSALGGQSTFYLIHRKRMSTVRASSGSTLLFALLISGLPAAQVLVLRAAFFGATFVGMTDPSRLGWKRVLGASLIFGLIFHFLIPWVQGFGGGLGAAAFVSSGVVYAGFRVLKKMLTN